MILLLVNASTCILAWILTAFKCMGSGDWTLFQQLDYSYNIIWLCLALPISMAGFVVFGRIEVYDLSLIHISIEQLQDPMYQSLYQAFLQTQEQYTFYTAPQYEDYLELEMRFEDQIRQKLQIARRSYVELPEQSMVELVRAAQESFMRDYQP